MNYNIIFNQERLGFQHILPLNHTFIQYARPIMPYLTILAYFVQFRSLKKLIQHCLGPNSKNIAILLAFANPITYYEFTLSKISAVLHTLIILIVSTDNQYICALTMSLLIYIQPTYSCLLLVIYHRHNFRTFLYKLTLCLLLVYVGEYCVAEWDPIVQQYRKIYAPMVYQPNFNLIWLFFVHFFKQYKQMYCTILFCFPLAFVYPLSLVARKLPKRPQLNCVLLVVCLNIVYYFSISTTIFDIYFLYLLLIPCYNVISQIPITIIYVLGSLLFVCLSLKHSQDWESSFTVTISFVFYMITTFYAFNTIFVVELINELITTIVGKEPEDKQSIKSRIIRYMKEAWTKM